MKRKNLMGSPNTNQKPPDVVDHTETVTAIFQALLGRSPDEPELARFEGELRAGLSLGRLLEEIVGSGEFNRRSPQRAEFVPAGHFYSVIPSGETRADFLRRWPELRQRRELPGIALDHATLRSHFDRILKAIPTCPLPTEKAESWRYHFENPAYSYGDGFSLYAMMLHLSPQRIIEVGSGYSSALMLDINECAFGNEIDSIFVEPFPELLFSLFKSQDRERCRVLGRPCRRLIERPSAPWRPTTFSSSIPRMSRSSGAM